MSTLPATVASTVYAGKILVGYILSYRLFQYLTYKSLESLLVTYPNANFHVRFIAPKSVANDRCGEMIAITTFSKYEKQGLNITTEVATVNDPAHRQSLGYNYWKSEYARALIHNVTTSTNRVPVPTHNMDYYPPPYHLLLYDTFVQLNKDGGMYIDLSWMHLRPMDALEKLTAGETVAGYQMKVLCNDQDLPPPSPRAFPRPSFHCKASTVLMFSTHHPVLDCIIAEYAQPDFLLCLREDADAQGAFCIDRALQTCFVSTNTHNALLPELFSSGHAIDVGRCYQTNHEHGRHHIHGTDSRSLNHSKSSIPADCKHITAEHSTALILSNLSTSSYQLGSRQQLVWMNVPAFSTQWLVPSVGSLFDRRIQHNTLALRAIYRSRVSHNLDLTNYTRPVCSSYAMPHDANTPRDVRERGQMSCALSYVLPGFMKSASTYIYGTIDNHPWVVRALRGFDYKEAGCYGPEIMRNVSRRHERVYCYPFVEHHDQVVYGDGAIIYAPRQDVVTHLLRDNPQIKVLFSVRDPIERGISIHRYDYRNLKSLNLANLNDCILTALNLRVFQSWYHLATQLSQPDLTIIEKDRLRKALSEKFMKDLARMFVTVQNKMRCYRVVHDSLYFPQIYHWYNATGSMQNIRVLNVQKLQPHRLSREVKQQAVPLIDDTDLRDLFLSTTTSDKSNKSTIHGRSDMKSQNVSGHGDKKRNDDVKPADNRSQQHSHPRHTAADRHADLQLQQHGHERRRRILRSSAGKHKKEAKKEVEKKVGGDMEQRKGPGLEEIHQENNDTALDQRYLLLQWNAIYRYVTYSQARLNLSCIPRTLCSHNLPLSC